MCREEANHIILRNHIISKCTSLGSSMCNEMWVSGYYDRGANYITSLLTVTANFDIAIQSIFNLLIANKKLIRKCGSFELRGWIYKFARECDIKVWTIRNYSEIRWSKELYKKDNYLFKDMFTGRGKIKLASRNSIKTP